MRRIAQTTALVVSLTMSGMAGAALHDRGNGLIYDDVLDITWLQNAFLGATNTFGLPTETDLGVHPFDSSGVQGRIFAGGFMNWPGALFWIDAMNAANGGEGHLGYTDWRLPSMDVNGDQSNTVAGQGIVNCSAATEVECRDNELGYMYSYNLAPGAPPTPLLTDLTGNQGLIQNIEFAYWSGTELAPNPIGAWYRDFFLGGQVQHLKGGGFAAWAVRPGDVAARVPALVGPVWLGLLALGMGVLGFGVSRRRWSSLRG